MFERYHLSLAMLAVLAGVLVAVLDCLAPRISSRSVALACAAGAVLGSWGNQRGLIWVIPALVIVAIPDDPVRTHPLGRFALPLTVVALAGIWAAVPDTEPPLAAAAALLPIAVVHAARSRLPGPAATLSVVVAMVGAVWVGSAGWGAALATVGAVGLIASAPLVIGFGSVASGRRLSMLVATQALVGLVLPRLIMSRSVAVAVAIALAVNVILVVVAYGSGAHGSGRPASTRLP